MSAVWRSLTQSSAAAADAGMAKKLLEGIQRALYEAFLKQHNDGGGVRALSVDDIAPIKALCDQLTPAHFQLKVPEPLSASARQQEQHERGDRNCVKYQHIWENDLFSMGIFILPPGASIPLHDHPEMSVISRVLYGSLHVTSCDFVSPKEASYLFNHAGRSSASTSPVSSASTDHGPTTRSSSSSTTTHAKNRRIARIFHDGRVTAPHTSALLPDEGNLHEFVADDEQGCAIFDILTPPYEPEDGRDCTYYRIVGDGATLASSSEQGGDNSHDDHEYLELEEFEPTNFEVRSEPYRGPQLSFPTTA